MLMPWLAAFKILMGKMVRLHSSRRELAINFIYSKVRSRHHTQQLSAMHIVAKPYWNTYALKTNSPRQQYHRSIGKLMAVLFGINSLVGSTLSSLCMIFFQLIANRILWIRDTGHAPAVTQCKKNATIYFGARLTLAINGAIHFLTKYWRHVKWLDPSQQPIDHLQIAPYPVESHPLTL
jgi:hypothetical protein